VNFTFADVVGLCGSVIFIGAFSYANAAEQMNKILFNSLNLIGAFLLMFSLWYRFNLAAFMLEAVWAVIALVGLVRALMANAKRAR
jgi:ABC-type uncharacterized transport system permease subunit